jgi:hypothetical protein
MSEDEDNVLERAEGTKIEWASGKNPTVKVLPMLLSKSVNRQLSPTDGLCCRSPFGDK